MTETTRPVRIETVPASAWKATPPAEWEAVKALGLAEGVHYVVVNDALLQGMFRPEFLQIGYGGSGSSKSHTKAIELLIKAMRQPYFRLLFVRKYQEQVRDSQFLLFKGLIDRYGWQPFFKIKEAEMDIVCTLNGNLLLSGGLDNVEKLKSTPDVTDIWIEEPLDKKGSVTAEDFTELERRLRCPLAPNHLHLTFNPVSKQSWIYRLLFKEDTVYRSQFKLKTTYRDNAFRPADEDEKYERLRVTNPEEYKIYALGEWGDADDLENRLFLDDDVEDLFTNSFIQPTGTRYATADIAHEGKDKCVFLAWDGWVVVDVEVLDAADAPVVIARFRAFCERNRVPGQNAAFDAAGIGNYLTGFFRSSIAFNGGASPLKPKALTDRQKEVAPRPEFKNLRAQVFHGMAEKVRECAVYFAFPSAAVRDRLGTELRAIKRIPTPDGGKYQIVPKSQIKDAIGFSTDFADPFSMRFVFELAPPPKKVGRAVRGMG